MRPAALEPLEPFELRHVGRRQRAHRGDQEACRDLVALVGVNHPQIALFVECTAGHPRAECDVALEVVALRHMLEVAQDLGLSGIALGPLPVLQQLLVPGEAVDIRIGIAAGTGIAVPVPRTADAVARLEDAHLQAQRVAQRLQHVEPGKPRADHDGIEIAGCVSHAFLQRCCFVEVLRRSG